ncbi:hypothetical protein [Streptomyces sp. NPDC049040]|uniref:hypothetical protein n=1 Tax=Streptomyces sp. NPDC049040 TaxID=3365593 RepID=UPI003721F51A
MSGQGMREVAERAGVEPVFAQPEQERCPAGSRVRPEIPERARPAGGPPADLDVDHAVARPSGPRVHLRRAAGSGSGTEEVHRAADGFLAATARGG